MVGAARTNRTVRIVTLFLVVAMLLTGFLTVWNAGAGAQDGTDFAGTAVAIDTPTPVAEASATPLPEPLEIEDPAVIDGLFRIVLQSAARGEEIEELELPPRTGREWVAVVVDVINFSTLSTSMQPSRFKLRLTGGEVGGMARSTTEQTADLLNMNPRDIGDDLLLQAGDSLRFVFVFQIDAGLRDPALVYQYSALPLENRIAMNIGFDDLPVVASAPALTPAVIAEVIDGETIRLAGGVEGERTMYGLNPPAGGDCFADQAIERLQTVINFNVLVEEVEGDTEEIYLWLPFTEGNRVLINQDMVISGHAASDIGAGAVFSDWFEDSEFVAQMRTNGLWGQCTSANGVARPSTIERGVFDVTFDGQATSAYLPWVDWSPIILRLPNLGAIAFFSAEDPPVDASTPVPDDALERRIVYSLYDPDKATWSVAAALPEGGNLQFGVSGVVDSQGRVHIVYSDRLVDAPAALSTLKYMVRETNGVWSSPVNVGANSRAGHQISPSLAIGSDDTLYVVWQDQRRFSEEARAAGPANADVFFAFRKPGEDWTTPAPVNEHSDAEATNRPILAVDGDRLVVVWSVYLIENLTSANRVDWSYVDVAAIGEVPEEAPWAAALPLVAGRGEAFGGRLLDLEASPAGGVVFVFGRQNNDTFLFLRRLPALATEWSGDVLLTFGNRGTFPALSISQDGTIYTVYSMASGDEAAVAGVALAHNSVVPGPEVVLTGSQEGSQGIPGITTDATGLPWVIYFNQPPGATSATSVEAIRNFLIPRSIDELRAILGEED